MKVNHIHSNLQENWFNIYGSPAEETQKVINLFNLYINTRCSKGCSYGTWMHIIESQIFLHPEIKNCFDDKSYSDYIKSRNNLLDGALHYFKTSNVGCKLEPVDKFLSIVMLSGKYLEMYKELQVVKSHHKITDDFLPTVFIPTPIPTPQLRFINNIKHFVSSII